MAHPAVHFSFGATFVVQVLETVDVIQESTPAFV